MVNTESNFPPLFGERIELSSLDESGLAGWFDYSKDERLYRYLEFLPHSSIEDTRRYLQRLHQRSEDGMAHYWFIRLRESAKVIGTIGVHSIDWRKGQGELGYGIAPDHWGHGYFQEALQVLLHHLFVKLRFHRVSATTAAENLASIRALQRAGFSQEGIFRDYYLAGDGRRFAAATLSLLAPDYAVAHPLGC